MSKRPSKKRSTRDGSHLVLVLPDLHLPVHDRSALRVVLNAFDHLKPRRVVILGDWLDAAFASAHPASSREEAKQGGYIANEIEPCRRLLSQFEEHAEEVIFIEGNHEFRVERLITRERGAWLAIPELVLPKTLLSMDRQKKFIWVPYQHNSNPDDGYSLPHYKIADGLIAVHGWSTSKHSARKHLELVRGWSIVYGHTHRAQSDSARHPLTGIVNKAWSPGCLTNLQPMWQHGSPNEWTHGFSLIYCRDDLSKWTSYTVTIDQGECILPDGTKITDGGVKKPLHCEATISKD